MSADPPQNTPPNTRKHHFNAKYLLVQMALQSPPAFFARFGHGGDTEYLPDLWAALGLDLEPEERVSNEGTRVWYEVGDAQHAEALILTLPQPLGRNEAFFIGVLRHEQHRCRVFSLELSMAPPAYTPTTMLVEFRANGRALWGPGSAPESAAFLALIRSIVADPSAGPLTFTELPLA